MIAQTVPAGTPPTLKGASNPSPTPGCACSSAGKARSGSLISRTVSCEMTSPHGLCSRGMVPLRYGVQAPAVAAQRKVPCSPPGSSRLMPAESERVSSMAISTNRCSTVLGAVLIASISAASARASASWSGALEGRRARSPVMMTLLTSRSGCCVIIDRVTCPCSYGCRLDGLRHRLPGMW